MEGRRPRVHSEERPGDWKVECRGIDEQQEAGHHVPDLLLAQCRQEDRSPVEDGQRSFVQCCECDVGMDLVGTDVV